MCSLESLDFHETSKDLCFAKSSTSSFILSFQNFTEGKTSAPADHSSEMQLV